LPTGSGDVSTVEYADLLTTVDGWYSGSWPVDDAVPLDSFAGWLGAAVELLAAAAWLAGALWVTVSVGVAAGAPLGAAHAAKPTAANATAPAANIRAFVPSLSLLLIISCLLVLSWQRPIRASMG